jgi:alkylhydroperoxidase family enzyme
LSAEEILDARRAIGADEKSDAVLKLARSIALKRGQVSDAELQAARIAGLNDGEIVEVVLHVAMNTMTNYLNNVARTVIDFSEVKPGEFEHEPELAGQNA